MKSRSFTNKQKNPVPSFPAEHAVRSVTEKDFPTTIDTCIREERDAIYIFLYRITGIFKTLVHSQTDSAV